jgi:prepilin-type N-terminal cleavage/methylation domain-containing protein
MTSNTHPLDSHRRVSRRGFTLTEMLVVIGIIVLVLSIATPMVTRAWRAGDRARTGADLQAIAAALEAYRQDHGMYPPVSPGPAFVPGGPTDFNGARLLCRALIAPGPATGAPNTIFDGAGTAASGSAAETLPGPGFRTRGTTGRVYGPYLPPDRFKLGDASGNNSTQLGTFAILDRYNRPILYYPATGKPNIRLDRSYAAPRIGNDKPMYNTADNTGANTRPEVPNVLALMLGDTNMDGKITAPEQPAFEGPYILWSCGPDETFGPPLGLPPTSPAPTYQTWLNAVNKSDDVTNFRN